MTSVDINGVQVIFPHEPYEIQKDYMRKVIECLQTQTHAILESPTGTGKTLSLLCSSLSWLLSEKLKIKTNTNNFVLPETEENLAAPSITWGPSAPRILYTSRTHSQLSQAMQELKQTVYKDMVKASILGSRSQMCIKKEVLEEESNSLQVMKCRTLVKARQCSYQYGVEKQMPSVISSANVWDIEDLVKDGKRRKYCPYYMARHIKKEADITFVPYNYVLDPSARSSLDLELQNCIIIFDEAHNVEKTCEESASVQITTTDIAMAIDELTSIMKYMESHSAAFEMDSEVSKDFTLEDLVTLKMLIMEFEKVISEVEVRGNIESDTYDGLYLRGLLDKAGIDSQNRHYISNVADKLVQYSSTSQIQAFNRNGANLIKFREMLLMVSSHDIVTSEDRVKKCFRVHIREEVVNGWGRTKKNASGWTTPAGPAKKREKIINYWCFSPGFGIDSLMKLGVRNIILTSGTLAPLKPLISELAIDVPIRLENPHIISKSQILVKVLSHGAKNVLFDSSFKNRENLSYVDSLGTTIKVLSRMIPEGLLVFFPSYPILKSCSDRWQENGTWSGISSHKPIFVEPRNKDDFNNVIAEYYAEIHKPRSNGACFFAVLRGKVSEGLDFANENGRGVIITGLPFPPLKDPRVVLKRKYLDATANRQNEMANGQKWYSLEAIRAVNQAIGRVIRHKRDYGCILLCDHRFNNPSLKCDLSRWLRDYIESPDSFPKALGGITNFFRGAKKEFPTSNDALEVAAGPASISYNSNETAFGTSMIFQTEKKYVNLPSGAKESELTILKDYKYAEEVPESSQLRKNDGISRLSQLDNHKSSYRFQQTFASSDGVVKNRELNPSKKPKLEYSQPRGSQTPESSEGLVKIHKKPRVKSQTRLMDQYLRLKDPEKPTDETTIASGNLITWVKKEYPDKYVAKCESFSPALKDYKAHRNIFNFIESVHELLQDCVNSNEPLFDIQKFIASEHKLFFETYIRRRQQWDDLTSLQRTTNNYNDYLLKKMC